MIGCLCDRGLKVWGGGVQTELQVVRTEGRWFRGGGGVTSVTVILPPLLTVLMVSSISLSLSFYLSLSFSLSVSLTLRYSLSLSLRYSLSLSLSIPGVVGSRWRGVSLDAGTFDPGGVL